ncbi:MAG: DUF1489 domain-containing protein [Rhodobacteraceae bacterium CG17_big_fil_post_rev_8_21_14_2_50_65_11]|nr:MAG: DUF1489 domain-containing protein [Rhodobacteraceae bacterium CG17_big_fil_post_rev_8_21_14_2_50_65_11]
MAEKFTHLIKLSVGTETVDDLAAWQASAHDRWPDGQPRHVTRMWPKREAEIVNNGSIYWVIKGFVQVRQRVLRLDEVIGHDGIRRCAIVLDKALIRVEATPKRPFQGWRYLNPQDAPRDLSAQRAAEDRLPPDLQSALADIGVF